MNVNNIRLLKKSRVADELIFNDSYIANVGYFSLNLGYYHPEGRILFSPTKKWPSVLAIHGARSDYTKLNTILYFLQKEGVSSLSFNLSGHNLASGINLEETSLANNLNESYRFLNILDRENIAVMGYSLGGALALKLAASNLNINKIILFCPAVYSDSAYLENFGPKFKKEISIPFGFLNTDSFDYLSTYHGDIMLIIGQYDGVASIHSGGILGTSAGIFKINGKEQYSAIPAEVIEKIKNSLPNKQLNILQIAGCDHGLSTWFRKKPLVAKLVANHISKFLNGEAGLQGQFLVID
jgi:pimeloyl-ACP methyl ester carboxylesterase